MTPLCILPLFPAEEGLDSGHPCSESHPLPRAQELSRLGYLLFVPRLSRSLSTGAGRSALEQVQISPSQHDSLSETFFS